MNDINNMSGPEFDTWLRSQAGEAGVSGDEQLAQVVSMAIMETVPEKKAALLLETANMCMAMADRSLGCQVPVATCLTLTRH